MSHIPHHIEPLMTSSQEEAISEFKIYNFNHDFNIIYTYFNNDISFSRSNIVSWLSNTAIVQSYVQYSENLPEWSKSLILSGVNFYYVYHIMQCIDGEVECISNDNNVSSLMSTGESTIDKNEKKGIAPSGSFTRIGANNYTTCCLVPTKHATAEDFGGYILNSYTLQTNENTVINLSNGQVCTIHTSKNSVLINDALIEQNKTIHISDVFTVNVYAQSNGSMGIIAIK